MRTAQLSAVRGISSEHVYSPNKKKPRHNAIGILCVLKLIIQVIILTCRGLLFSNATLTITYLNHSNPTLCFDSASLYDTTPAHCDGGRKLRDD